MTDVAVKPKPLSQQQEQWVQHTCAQIDREETKRLIVDMVNIRSHPGQERDLAQFMTSWMTSIGLDASYQAVDDQQGNAIGYLRGSGGGAELLMWGELDICLGIPEEERLGMGSVSRQELKPQAKVQGGYIIGLGAENPKGHAACAALAVKAIKQANIPLKGTLILGMPGGGMPTSKWDAHSDRANVAHGVGCEFMLQQGVHPDLAIAAKPVYAVSWEEAGLCWFRVTVKGNFGYSGARHLIPYNNAITNAAKVILGLEEWLPKYAERSASGIVAPQGIIGAIEGGCSYKPSFYPEVCHVYMDIRISPRMQPMEVKRQLEEALRNIQSRNPGLELDCQMVLAIPGSHTDPDNWVVQSCMRAWESVEGRTHNYDAYHSGATDVNVLRHWGVPVARLGLPPLELPAGMKEDLASWMGAVSVENAHKLIRCYIYSIIDTCTRDLEEIQGAS